MQKYEVDCKVYIEENVRRGTRIHFVIQQFSFQAAQL